MFLAEYTKLLIALVAIIDIPGNIPIFLTQTSKLDSRDRMVTALVAATATCVILLVFAMFGEVLLGAFGITIAAFKVLGGLVVLLIALDMLGLLRDEEALAQTRAPDHGAVAIGIFPLAVPLFAGPGAITAVMVYAHDEVDTGVMPMTHDEIVIAVVLSACALLAVGLLLASALARFIGPIAQVVLNRLLGMIVGALGVEFILEGLEEYFPLVSGV